MVTFVGKVEDVIWEEQIGRCKQFKNILVLDWAKVPWTFITLYYIK